MKTIFAVAIVLVVGLQAVTSQCVPPCAAPVYAPTCGCGCGCAPVLPAPVLAPAPVIAPAPVVAPVIQTSVAGTLADTLSLLTVSSLLAEKLPYGYPVVAAPMYGGCGCGCGYGYVL